MRILSGLQPTGRLHIGNYFGMMEPALRLQDEGEAYYFIADYHALTSLHNAAELRDNVRNLAIDFLACGLDPNKAVFFKQSDVPEHTELAWILSTVTPMPMLENCHSYKDKTARGMVPNAGLFTYPVLMTADILIYDSDLVPVGKDQKQHLEVARDIATKMNLTFGEGTLKIPTARIREETAVVPGLDGQKMSKSYGNTIALFEDEKALKKKIMGIPTDSTPVELPKPTENSAILNLYRLFASDAEYNAMVGDFQKGGIGYGDFKKRLLEKTWSFFAAAREKREKIVADKNYVDDVLRAGAAKARAVARQTMDRVRAAVGL
ncbi:MAG: tryptophan--tRNA ligase [Verrucomicrobiaceae bacterium]